MDNKKKLTAVQNQLIKMITEKASVGQINPYPTFEVLFTTLAKVAIQKGERGILCIILEDETSENKWETLKTLSDVTEELFTKENVQLVTTAYEVFSPSKVLVRRWKDTEPIGDVLKEIENRKISQLCFPTATNLDDNTVTMWAKSEANKRNVVYVTAQADLSDSCKVVELNNKIVKHKLIENYTPQMFTVMVAGAIAGCPLNRSLDQAVFANIVEVDFVEPVKGKFTIYEDDERFRVVQAQNSKTTFDDVLDSDARYIKIFEGMTIVMLDIQDAFKNYWCGLYMNNYDNKRAFCDNVTKVYFAELAPNVLSPDFENYIDIDVEANRRYIVTQGEDPDTMSETEIKTYPTGGDVFLTGKVKFANVMINLSLTVNY
ncbi:MAG: phage tail sheath protein [Cetobacterium sp.]|uniref:phage tail sheath protein n=1 Tax=Cetobacterium sp. TaxID=2071632 RepID=UPI003F313B0C